MTVFLPEGEDAASRALVLTGPPPQQAPARLPGNITQASAWMALAAALRIRLHIRDVLLVLPGMTFVDLLVRMGVRIREEVITLSPHPSGNLDLRYSNLRGLIVPHSLARCVSDDLAIIAVLATLAKGTTTIQGWRKRDDDSSQFLRRIFDNLRLMAVSIEELDDELHITGSPSLQAADLQTHGDPRLATAFSLAALLARGDSIIRDITPGSIPFQNAWPDRFTVLN